MLIKDLLYILQCEQYDLKRFLKFAYTHPKWWRFRQRGSLTWTSKLKATAVIAAVLAGAIIAASYILYGNQGWLVLFFILPALPLFISASSIILVPLDRYLKQRLVGQATRLLQTNKGSLQVIGITGSYGKTSTKEILSTILSEKWKVQKIGDNINTDLGVAEYIIKNISTLKSADIFIVEMGAYKQGEIKKICGIVQPDYAVITGINESHLERFGSLQNTIQAKFELAQAARKTVALNFDDRNVKENCSRFALKDYKGVSRQGIEITALDNYVGLQFVVDGQRLHTRLLAEHNVTLILLSIEIARSLGMDMETIARAVEKIPYVPHRLEPIYNSQTNIWVIDDSYNGNIDGIVSGIEVLRRAPGRKVVLTPGLVELGQKEKEIHERIAKLYADNAVDLVLLIKNRVTGYIINEFDKRGFQNYKLYQTTREAHADLANVLRSGDTIIFQNDWPDNYF